MNEFAIKVWNRRTVYTFYFLFLEKKNHKIKLLRENRYIMVQLHI